MIKQSLSLPIRTHRDARMCTRRAALRCCCVTFIPSGPASILAAAPLPVQYTAQREFTCQSRPGSWRFEAIDIDTYCDWGVSYVKTDA